MLLTTENSVDIVFVKIIRRVEGHYNQHSTFRVVSANASYRISKTFAQRYIETVQIHTMTNIHNRILLYYANKS